MKLLLAQNLLCIFKHVRYFFLNLFYHVTNQQTTQIQRPANQYAQPIRAGTLPHPLHHRASLPQLTIPDIPEPDYSESDGESDGEDENSVLVAHNTKMNERIAVPIETSGNSNTRYVIVINSSLFSPLKSSRFNHRSFF